MPVTIKKGAVGIQSLTDLFAFSEQGPAKEGIRQRLPGPSKQDLHPPAADAKELKDSDVGERLLHFIKAEKPYFLPKIELPDLRSIFAVRPKQTYQRILAQQGAFLIFGLRSSLPDENEFGIDIVRTKVRASAKQPLLDELDGININPSTLFPEIESAAKYIMSKIPLSDQGDDEPD